MRVGFIDPFPARNTNSWVQTVQFLKQGLQEQGAELVIVDDIKLSPSIVDRMRQLSYMCLGEKYLFEREPKLLKQMGAAISDRFRNEELDILFCPSSLPVAYVDKICPIVVWTDSTFGGLVDLYQPFSNVCNRSSHYGHLTERISMLNADLSIYSSEWAAAFASEHYRIDREQIETIPLGANLKNVPDQEAVIQAIEQKNSETVELLFMGYDWERKGGAHAVKTHLLLRSHGIKSRLTIVGCTPPAAGKISGVNVIGKLDKAAAQDAERLDEIMLSAHFLILPSQADCTAIVFSEAAAYGLPVISTDVGGHRSIIQQGENGFLFSPEQPAPLMTEKIISLAEDPTEYNRIALRSRQIFDERLSWNAGVEKIMNLFNGLISSKKHALKRAG